MHPFANNHLPFSILSLALASSPTSSSASCESSNRDTQFCRLDARVAETAVERNFRSRKKPRAQTSPLNFAPCKNLAVSLRPSPFPPVPSLRPPPPPGGDPTPLSPPRSVRSVRPRSGSALHARPAARLRDRRKEKEKQVRSFRDGKTRSGEITQRWSRHEAGRGGGWGGGEREKGGRG